jgi:hypothetical protein
MAQIVAEALDRGEVGFSSNRFPGHKLPDGRAVPGTYADVEELELIGYEVGKRQTVIEMCWAVQYRCQRLRCTGARFYRI